MHADKSEDGVLENEAARGRALESDDFAALRAMTAPDITHTHTRGVTDDFESYFRYIENELEFLECRRGPLSVRRFGDLAIMTGTMHNIVRRRGTDVSITTDAEALQVWRWQDGRWMLAAFQATALPKNV